MSNPDNRPRVTVAAVAEREGRFLFVEERVEGEASLRLNQPAGHLEAGESLLAAVAREALEETGHRFTPHALLGVYHYSNNGATYVRFAFTGEALAPSTPVKLDAGIVQALWLTPEELAAQRARHRSALVLACVQDYLRGQRFPLEVVRSLMHILSPSMGEG
jgi:8-oxo-dGTP pyrophosphatase MutT (NUDIX family)